MRPFRYALINRPAGFETLPKNISWSTEPRPSFCEPHFELARHGVLLCDRELNREELEAFELGLLIDDHTEMAGAVAAALSEYSGEVEELVNEYPDVFRQMVMDQARSWVGLRYFSIAWPDSFLAEVAELMAADG